MSILTQVLYAASNALLIPVVLLLLFAFALTIYGFGGLAAEAVERWRKRAAFSR